MAMEVDGRARISDPVFLWDYLVDIKAIGLNLFNFNYKVNGMNRPIILYNIFIYIGLYIYRPYYPL